MLQCPWCCIEVQRTTSPSVPEFGTPGQKDLFLSTWPKQQNKEISTTGHFFYIGSKIPSAARIFCQYKLQGKVSPSFWHTNITSQPQSPCSKPPLLSPIQQWPETEDITHTFRSAFISKTSELTQGAISGWSGGWKWVKITGNRNMSHAGAKPTRSNQSLAWLNVYFRIYYRFTTTKTYNFAQLW